MNNWLFWTLTSRKAKRSPWAMKVETVRLMKYHLKPQAVRRKRPKTWKDLRKLEDSPPLEERSFIKECEVTFSRKPWQDHRCLPIPYSIGEVEIEGAVCDFNSRLYWMTYSLAEKLELNLESMKVKDMYLTLADDSEIYLGGILDVPIKVISLEMKLDFVLIDDVPDEIPISFGRPSAKRNQFFLQNEQEEIVPRTDDKEEAHDKKEDQEKQLVEIETDQRDASSVRDEDFYKGAEPQPMKSQKQDLQQKEQPSNKAEEKAEIDKVIDMICALFATVKLKRVWKQYPLFLKFLEFLTKKRKKTDDIFHISYKTP
ncbi:hypothetical protein QL285_081182 [Trifolium repens]|nr:hypothetical protein QL285_081182 [Trifolium repens]